MEYYIDQLIDDLHSIADKKTSKKSNRSPQDEGFKHIENVENYLHSKTKTIASVTGIITEQLPPPDKLSDNQMAKLSMALEQLLGSFHFMLDFPEQYPYHLRYPFIRDFWNEEHVPLSFGESHIEFCNYNKENCPFPDYCNICNESNEDGNGDLFTIPKKFESLLNPIAQSIDCGQIVYLNLDTIETEDITPNMEDPDDFEFNYGGCSWAQKPKFYEWENIMRFAPLESHESFRIMEAFADNIEDEGLKKQLFYALNHKKPFANFKWRIDNSKYSQDWFDFKQNWLEGYVREEICNNLRIQKI